MHADGASSTPVDPKGRRTTYHFDYGTDTAFANGRRHLGRGYREHRRGQARHRSAPCRRAPAGDRIPLPRRRDQPGGTTKSADRTFTTFPFRRSSTTPARTPTSASRPAPPCCSTAAPTSWSRPPTPAATTSSPTWSRARTPFGGYPRPTARRSSTASTTADPGHRQPDQPRPRPLRRDPRRDGWTHELRRHPGRRPLRRPSPSPRPCWSRRRPRHLRLRRPRHLLALLRRRHHRASRCTCPTAASCRGWRARSPAARRRHRRLHRQEALLGRRQPPRLRLDLAVRARRQRRRRRLDLRPRPRRPGRPRSSPRLPSGDPIRATARANATGSPSSTSPPTARGSWSASWSRPTPPATATGTSTCTSATRRNSIDLTPGTTERRPLRRHDRRRLEGLLHDHGPARRATTPTRAPTSTQADVSGSGAVTLSLVSTGTGGAGNSDACEPAATRSTTTGTRSPATPTATPSRSAAAAVSPPATAPLLPQPGAARRPVRTAIAGRSPTSTSSGPGSHAALRRDPRLERDRPAAAADPPFQRSLRRPRATPVRRRRRTDRPVQRRPLRRRQRHRRSRKFDPAGNPITTPAANGGLVGTNDARRASTSDLSEARSRSTASDSPFNGDLYVDDSTATRPVSSIDQHGDLTRRQLERGAGAVRRRGRPVQRRRLRRRLRRRSSGAAPTRLDPISNSVFERRPRRNRGSIPTRRPLRRLGADDRPLLVDAADR